jgi:hypothetical protein
LAKLASQITSDALQLSNKDWKERGLMGVWRKTFCNLD